MADFGGSVPAWGYSESPLVDGDQVVCTPGGKRGAILALDKMTGKKIWQTAGVNDKAHYSSILPMKIGGSKQYVQLLVKQVVGINPKSGKLMWSVPWNGSTAVIPSPVNVDGKVYVTSGYNAGSMLVNIRRNKAKQAWYENGMQNHHGGVVLVGDHLYGSTDKNRGAFACQDAKTGEIIWREKKIKKGSLIYADGLFYHVQKSGGKVLLLDATPNGLNVVSEFVLEPQSERRNRQGAIWVHPVIANGKLYLRDQDILSCYDSSGK
jgi:outer membrane protein assembly factor BamB